MVLHAKNNKLKRKPIIVWNTNILSNLYILSNILSQTHPVVVDDDALSSWKYYTR
jgi:hypothetical protein